MSHKIYNGDCAEVMASMESCSVDAIVTDPPYGLAFMGAKWDSFGGSTGNQTTSERQAEGKRYAKEKKGAPRYANSHGKRVTRDEMVAFQERMTPILVEALRVAKPGAHLLCFGGTRTFHRMACAIEDAGWEIRDCVMWTYGCLDEETEVLVDGEFVPYTKAGVGGSALGYDIKSGAFSWQRIEDTYLYDYDDTAYAIQSDSTDQLVSRNHRCIVERDGYARFELAEVLALYGEANVPVFKWDDNTPVAQFIPARVTPIHYKGKMWCIKVATGAFVARRHGKVFVTGNSGFPKSMDVGKAIDKALGAERKKRNGDGEHTGNVDFGMKNRCPKCGKPYFSADPCKCPREDKVPVTDQAKKWDGWGTCLKPAWEPIIVARKPLDGTVAHNVLTHGCGALNIDGCRVGTEERTYKGMSANKPDGAGCFRDDAWTPKEIERTVSGRFPANLVHDGSEEVRDCFPDSNGQQGDLRSGIPKKTGVCYGDFPPTKEYLKRSEQDKNAARFFYCAKASKADRGEGNDHPTVKPNALMRWLVRLVCPHDSVVLDPFMGSGSTGVAAVQEGLKFVGIDLDEHYCEIAENRISEAEQEADEDELDQMSLF